jgi:hypothetical protein
MDDGLRGTGGIEREKREEEMGDKKGHALIGGQTREDRFD